MREIIGYIPPQPITRVSMGAAREALIEADLIDTVDVVINGIEDEKLRRKAQTWWEYSATVRRDSKWITLLAPSLGLSEEDIDNLFIMAKDIDDGI